MIIYGTDECVFHYNINSPREKFIFIEIIPKDLLFLLEILEVKKLGVSTQR